MCSQRLLQDLTSTYLDFNKFSIPPKELLQKKLTNSTDPDQTPQEQSGLGPYCFFWQVCPNIQLKYGTFSLVFPNLCE